MDRKIKILEMTVFNIAANSLKYHLETILNFFIKRNTNANSESFNSKIKLIRANQRGSQMSNSFSLEWRKFLPNLNKIYVTQHYSICREE